MVIIKFRFDEFDTFFKLLKTGHKQYINKMSIPIDIPFYFFEIVSIERPITKIHLDDVNYQYFLEGLKRFSNNKKYRKKKEGYVARKDDFSYEIE